MNNYNDIQQAQYYQQQQQHMISSNQQQQQYQQQIQPQQHQQYQVRKEARDVRGINQHYNDEFDSDDEVGPQGYQIIKKNQRPQQSQNPHIQQQQYIHQQIPPRSHQQYQQQSLKGSHLVTKDSVNNSFLENQQQQHMIIDNSINLHQKSSSHSIDRSQVHNNSINKQHHMKAPQQLHRESGLEKLRHCSGIFVKQKFEILEAITGCETENRYTVYEADENYKAYPGAIFRCKERSSFCVRNCLSGDCRPFGMDVEHDDEFVSDIEDDSLFLRLTRPFTPTFLCFARPTIEVYLNENGTQAYFGKVVSEWSLVDMNFDVYDKEDRIIYTIWGDGCQIGLYCTCPCDSCAKVELKIRNNDGQDVGEILKVWSGVEKEFFSDADNFYCRFPANATPIHKTLLLSAVLFIDYRYFENSPKDENKQYY